MVRQHQPTDDCHLSPDGEHDFYPTGFLACIWCALPFSRVPCTLTEERWITGEGPQGPGDGVGRGGLTERDVARLIFVRFLAVKNGR